MGELGLILAVLVPAGLILGVVVLNRSRARIERDGADYGGHGNSTGGSTWLGTGTNTWDSGTSASLINSDSSGGWDSGSNSSCDSDSGSFSSGDGGSSGDSGGSSDGGGSSGGCD